MKSQYWLMKSEPDVFSIDDLQRDQKTLWTGVRNYQARNFMMKDMKPGDHVLFYHSNAEPPGIAGFGKVLRINLADPTQFDKKSEYFDPKAKSEAPRWFCAEVAFAAKAPRFVSLEALRENSRLKDLLVLRKGQRLSIQPVIEEHFKIISELAGFRSKNSLAQLPEIES